MRNKKLFKSAVIITAVMLSVSGCAGGCSKQAEPVIAESKEETPEPEESTPEESEESLEPTPSPTVEPTEEPVEESSESEEVEQEESEPDLGYEIIPIDEVTMYATTNCNLRGGPGTQYDKVGSLSYAQEIVYNGKVEDGDKLWLVLKTDDGSTQMVSGSLVSRDKPQPQQSKPSGNTGTGGGSSQQPSGGGSTGGGNGGGSTGGGSSQPSGDDGTGVGGGALSGLGLQEAGGQGSGGGSGLNWTTD